MKDFQGKVAVITGGASGIGLAMARRFGAEGMKIVLADVEADALDEAARELSASGVETAAVPTDVSSAQEVRYLAQKTLDAFGAVHVVCNNAGVISAGPCWEAPLEDYEWVLGVNLWGVIHGIRTFVPILLEQECEGHVVNTASMAGMISLPYTGIYSMSKHAVLALSESLYHDLALKQAKVGVSALCPEQVATNIGSSQRNRPASAARPVGATVSKEREMVQRAMEAAIGVGTAPEVIAERVLQGIREERFYILSDDGWRRSCEARFEDIRAARNPTFVPPVAV